MTRPRRDRDDIFWSHVKIDQNGGCWTWIGYVEQRSGCGRFTYTDGPEGEGLQVKVYAHRYAYRTTGAKIINGIVVQTCGNKLCCNPAHLEDVDTAEIGRRRRKGHYKKDRLMVSTRTFARTSAWDSPHGRR